MHSTSPDNIDQDDDDEVNVLPPPVNFWGSCD